MNDEYKIKLGKIPKKSSFQHKKNERLNARYQDTNQITKTYY